MDKQNRVYPCSGLLSHHKKEEATDTCYRGVKLENRKPNERSKTSKATSCVIYMNCSGSDRKQTGFPGAGKGGMRSGDQSV